MLLMVVALAAAAGAPEAGATIPDANIQAGVNRGGFGMISGAYGQADFALSNRSAVGAYFGIDPNNIYFGDYGRGDNTFNDNVVVGGH